jgi:hypothetical protein
MTAKNLRPMFRTKEGKSLLAGVLPVALFASGHTFFVTRMAHLMRREPFMVHTTFQYAGAEGKRHRLREGPRLTTCTHSPRHLCTLLTVACALRVLQGRA